MALCAGCSSAPTEPSEPIDSKPIRKVAKAKTPESPSEPFPTVELTEGKAAEDRQKGVNYWSANTRKNNRVTIRGGRVFDQRGVVVPDSKSDHENQISYVMDPNGGFYIFNGYADPTIQHSSVFAGKDVAGAGDITIEKGKVVFIDASGDHYWTKPLFRNVLIRLRQLGVPTDKCIRRQTTECRPGSTDPNDL